MELLTELNRSKVFSVGSDTWGRLVTIIVIIAAIRLEL